MSKLGELDMIISDLRTAAASIAETADALTKMFSGGTDNEQQYKESAAKTENPKPDIKFEDIRAFLAEKSRAGYTEEVRALLKRHGADKLSQVEPEFYGALMEEAEAIGNGG